MDIAVDGHSTTSSGTGPSLQPCALHEVLTLLGDKWTIFTLSSLFLAPGHRLRFSELKAGVEGISQRMLTVVVRGLERDGLVTRHYLPEVPPRVEYELTATGRSMLPALEGLTGWIGAHWPAIEGSRKAYDAR